MRRNTRLDDLAERQRKRWPGDGTRRLLESDFVGCAEGPEDLATNYKHYLHQGLGDFRKRSYPGRLG